MFEGVRRRVDLIAVFESRAVLAATMDRMLAHGLLDLLDVGHSALIIVDENRQPLVVNNNVEPHEGRNSGAMLGAVLLTLGAVQGGVLDLPRLGAVLGVLLALLVGGGLGAAIGYGVARATRFGFAPVLLNDVSARLSASQVALVLQLRPAQAATLEAALAGPGVTVERRER